MKWFSLWNFLAVDRERKLGDQSRPSYYFCVNWWQNCIPSDLRLGLQIPFTNCFQAELKDYRPHKKYGYSVNSVFRGRDMNFVYKDLGAQGVVADKSSSTQTRRLLWACFSFNRGFIDLNSFVRFKMSSKPSVQDLTF